MSVPIYIGSERRGELRLGRDGPFTLFEARCESAPGLLRLSVCGADGGRGYLGVLRPQNGGLVLRRRLSRTAMRGFPDPIRCAVAEPAPPAAPEEPAESAPHWLPCPDGSLICFEDGCTLLALPCALRRAVPGLDLRQIDGKSYLVFRT